MTSSTQTTGTTSYPFSYQYSLTDLLTQITYPSGRIVGYVPNAGDQVQTIQNVTAGTNYATVQYSPAGGISSITTGNGVVQSVTSNDRFQPTQIQAISGTTNLLTLGLYPCASLATFCSTGNNGNLQSQTITAPSLSLSLRQDYTYDHLNRLTQAQETGGTLTWTQGYNYDAVGNRWVPTNTNLPPLTLETPSAASWYIGASAPNRIKDWSYDYNGNVTAVSGMSRTFMYDAENRQVSATINSSAASYGYDGLGQRVTRTAGGNTTTYVYDTFGNLAAEYSTVSPTSPCDTATCYAFLDHLGSTRMLTDSAGSATVTRYDYLPFGGELLASTNGRTTAMGYGSVMDSMNPRFTGKNRDSETGFDWFEIRHMSGAQGRFQSVDPGNAGSDPTNPQKWNAYAYVGNNPLSYTDPSGAGFLDWMDNFVFSAVNTAFFGIPDLLLEGKAFTWGLPNNGGALDLNLGSFGNPGFGGLQVGLPSGGPNPFIFDAREGIPDDPTMFSGLSINVSVTLPGQVKRKSAICPAVPAFPANANLAQNIADAENSASMIWAIPRVKWFYSQVHNKAPWDYKQQGKKLFQDFGNFNFGATGAAAGFTETTLLMGAGYAQEKAGTSLPEWGHWYGPPPFGDDPKDQAQIRSGITFYRNKCY